MAAVRATPRSSPGMVRSSLGSVGGFDRVERREQGLDGDAAAGDQLAARATQRNGDGRGPAVLPHEHGGGRPGLERGAGVLEVTGVEQAGRGAVEVGEGLAPVAEVGHVDRDDRAVGVLGDERDVEDADDPAVHEVDDQRGDLPGRLPAGPLQDDVVDGAHLFERLFAHCGSSRAVTAPWSAPTAGGASSAAGDPAPAVAAGACATAARRTSASVPVTVRRRTRGAPLAKASTSESTWSAGANVTRPEPPSATPDRS